MNISCETTLPGVRPPRAKHRKMKSTAKHTINKDIEKCFAGYFLVCCVTITILLHIKKKNNYSSPSFSKFAEML